MTALPRLRLCGRSLLLAGALLGAGCQSRSAEPAPAAPATEPAPRAASAPVDTLIAGVLARKAEMGLPRAFDGYTVDDVTAGAGVLVFHTRLDTPRPPALDTLRTQGMLAPVLAPRVCGEPPSRAILDAGGLYAYRFADVNGVYVTTVFVNRADCMRAEGR